MRHREREEDGWMQQCYVKIKCSFPAFMDYSIIVRIYKSLCQNCSWSHNNNNRLTSDSRTVIQYEWYSLITGKLFYYVCASRIMEDVYRIAHLCYIHDIARRMWEPSFITKPQSKVKNLLERRLRLENKVVNMVKYYAKWIIFVSPAIKMLLMPIQNWWFL